MKIIIDAMGGDNAPKQIVLGAIEGAMEQDVNIVLVGNESIIRDIAAKHSLCIDGNDKIEIVHTEGVITMEDPALSVVRDKRDSSMGVGLRMLADGSGDAFVSAGNTGALHAGSSLLVRRIKGIQRSAIATVLPFANPTLLIDSGANTEVEASHLLQFGVMGSIYMNKVLKVENPRVGLLNNGTEETKGTKKLVEAYQVLKDADTINFIGNVEGKTLPYGECDVIVTDGFTGNILLKSVEGLASYFMKYLKGIFTKNIATKMSYLGAKKHLHEMKNTFDASAYGGAPLLGLAKPVIKAHGSSDALAIKNAIRQAKQFVSKGVINEIIDSLAALSAKNDAEKEAISEENSNNG